MSEMRHALDITRVVTASMISTLHSAPPAALTLLSMSTWQPGAHRGARPSKQRFWQLLQTAFRDQGLTARV